METITWKFDWQHCFVPFLGKRSCIAFSMKTVQFSTSRDGWRVGTALEFKPSEKETSMTIFCSSIGF